MGSQENYEAIPIGMELGPLEIMLDDETVNNRTELVQWKARGLAESGFAPPGITISQHARMKFEALPDMRVSIWAKSEQEFLKPMKLGSKIFIRGRVVDKYVKRGRNYMVTDLETFDETGEILMRSHETAVYVE